MKQYLPALSQDEYETLKNDIKENGVQVPIFYDETGEMLDGNHRKKICKELEIKDIPSETKIFDNEKDKIKFILGMNIKRRHLSTEQCKQIAKDLKKEKWTQQEIADLFGIGRRTIGDWLHIKNFTKGGSADSKKTHYDNRIKIDKDEQNEIFDRINKGEKKIQIAADFKISPSKITQIKNKKEKEIKHIEEIKEKAKNYVENIDIRHADFQDEIKNIKDESVDCIFTDPPYPKEYLHLWKLLAEESKRVLKPSGFIITYSGTLHLSEIYNYFYNNLIYYWQFIEMNSGPTILINPRNIITGYKPILIFQKQPYKKLNKTLFDIINSPKKEKQLHKWQQTEYTANFIIDNFTNENDLVLDPFAGSGTILKICQINHRRFIGIESEQENIEIIKGRLSEEK